MKRIIVLLVLIGNVAHAETTLERNVRLADKLCENYGGATWVGADVIECEDYDGPGMPPGRFETLLGAWVDYRCIDNGGISLNIGADDLDCANLESVEAAQ